MPKPFTNQHDRMKKLAAEIIAKALSEGDDAFLQIAKFRFELSKCVTSHCVAEIAEIDTVCNSRVDELEQKQLIRQYHSGLLTWRRLLVECNVEWPASRVEGDPQGFVARFQPIAEKLNELIRWEENIFYPAIFGWTTNVIALRSPIVHEFCEYQPALASVITRPKA